MRTAPFLIVGAAVCVATNFLAFSAEAKVRVVPFSKVGDWQVRAVYGSSGPFDHCSANARYRSGTRVSIIVYRSGNWRLWFAHDAWPDRGRATFPATVQVDGRTVLSRNGAYKGRNAFIDLGRDIEGVKALMRGRTMAILTPAGTSRFSLNGTNRATRSLAQCWKAHYRSPTSGAFGSANNNATGGAFGGSATGRSSVNELSRANTLELATRYLSKGRSAYSILPQESAPLKHFPVNWKMQDGSIGGMRVLRNTDVAVGKILDSLLADQAKNCSGRNASQREPARLIKGRDYAKARGVCETKKGSVLNLTYKVVELGQRMIMIVMEVGSSRKPPVAGSRPSTAPAKPNNGKSGDSINVPGPNEL